MLNKTKKVAFLTSGLAGALVVSSAAGVALSSCTTTTSNTDSSDKYTYAIDWTDQDQVKQLTIDEQGLVYSGASKTEVIAVAPNTAATSVVIPASVRYITGYNQITKNSDGTIASSTTKGAFEGLVSLISVTFASDNTLVSVGDSAFKGCTYLSTISLPSSTSVVYNNAFSNCTNLRSINLVGVSYIGSAAFSGAMANGAGVSIDLSSASYIGDNAFNGCTSLVSANFSKNTTLSYIGVSAFAGAFVNGDTAATLDLSKATALKTISDSAFAGCTNLGSVVLSSSSGLTTIGTSAFSGASSLTQVGSTANTFTAPSSLGNYATSTTTNYVSSGIGANAFTGTKIATIDLSAVTATTPFTNATFKGMTSLAKVEFGSSSKITTIPYSLFEGDTALTSLTLPSSITTIQDGTHNTNANATYTDQRSPFYGSGLQTVDMSAITSYATGQTSWWGATIDNTTMVPVGLFQNLTSLTSVVLKKGTVAIGSVAFSGASALKTVKEGSTSTVADTTTGLIIPSTLEMINVAAFQGTGIESITFASTSSTASNSLWFLGKNAFQNTTELTSVDLTAADTTKEHSMQEGAITGTSTKSVSLTGLSAISAELFSGSTALKTVKLPSSTKQIYTEAFVNNTALTSVNFEDLASLDTITKVNFTGASSLSSIDLSKTALTATSYAIANLFTGLPTNATVKLGVAATSLNSTSFLIGENTAASVSARPTIEYPSGLTISTTTTDGLVGIGATGVSASSNNTMLEYVSNDFDLASSTNGDTVQEYLPKTFFGNTKLKKLTLSAKNLYKATSGSSPTQQASLFVHNAGGNTMSNSSESTYYKTTYLPFGNNSALTDLVFSGFTLASDTSITWPTESSNSNKTNSLYRTTSTTWAQVATIINKFASNSVSNLTAWPTTFTGGIDTNSKINDDSVVTGAGTTSTSGSYSVTFTNSNDVKNSVSGWTKIALSINNNISAGTTSSESFIHNGVKWTLNVTSSGAITLVGENITIYKVTAPNNKNNKRNQVYFGKDSDGNPTKITVTLNIYTPSSN